MWNVPVKLAQSEIQNERKNKYKLRTVRVDRQNRCLSCAF